MCNNTQKKKAAGAGKDFTLFFGVILHFNFKCVELTNLQVSAQCIISTSNVKLWSVRRSGRCVCRLFSLEQCIIQQSLDSVFVNIRYS